MIVYEILESISKNVSFIDTHYNDIDILFICKS